MKTDEKAIRKALATLTVAIMDNPTEVRKQANSAIKFQLAQSIEMFVMPEMPMLIALINI